jgi:hypothetical protein
MKRLAAVKISFITNNEFLSIILEY